jgi:hypothetical protein
MKSSATFAGLILAAITVWVSIPLPVAAVGSGEASREGFTFTLSADQPFAVPAGPWTGRTMAFAEPVLEKVSGRTIPTFTRKIVAHGKTFRYTMVGSDPFVKKAKKIVIPVQIIPVRFEFDDGSVFDPTLPSLPCEGEETALNLAQESPVFQDTDYGEGNRQFAEEIRRLEFWTQTGAQGAINPGYSVRVSTTVLPTARVVLNGFPTQALPCGRIGFIEIKTWINFVKATLFPQLRRLGVTAQTFPLFLFANVVMFNGERSDCCIFGYHTAFNSGGLQTYGVANYDLSGRIDGFPDVAALSHELAEWYDDPFVNNATPPWGHTGQVDGCQANLEVGDPLSGSLQEVLMPNGLTYHPQELAFFSWFFNQVPSLGINNWYSSGGTFVAPSDLCH